MCKNFGEKQEYSREDIIEFVSRLLKDGIISENEKQAINIDVLYKYTKSDLFASLKSAKEIYKEQPFYINIPAKDIYDDANDEMILVQGIIDLYYITKNDELVLLDYKTDFVLQKEPVHLGQDTKEIDRDVPSDEEEVLINRHKPQLMLYKEALENGLNRKVDRVLIYSTGLGKEILICQTD